MKKLTDSVWFLAVFNAHSYISNSKVWAPALQNKAALLCTFFEPTNIAHLKRSISKS